MVQGSSPVDPHGDFGLASVAGVVVTYRRPSHLAVMLKSLSLQTVKLSAVVVVDNDSEGSALAVVGHLPGVVYASSRSNLGPAGGFSLGVDQLPPGTRWVMFLDDDDPPTGPRTVEDCVSFLAHALSIDPATVGVGVAGAEFDRRSGRSRRPELASGSRAVPVDWIGSGQFPIYRVDALRQAQVPTPGLFWGYEDLEIGLALRERGGSLYRDRDHDHSVSFSFVSAKESLRRQQKQWRDYYTTRNLVYLSYQYCSRRVAILVACRTVIGRVVRSGGQGLLTIARLQARAVVDGLAGRLGRSVEPD